MTDFDLHPIIETIAEQKCILLIGPEAQLAEGNGTLTAALAQTVKTAHPRDVMAFYDKEDFYLFPDAKSKTRVYRTLKNFFTGADNQPKWQRTLNVYNTFAQIPFHLIINVNHDLFLKDIFEKQSFAHEFGIYRKHQSPAQVSAPTMHKPLIYNLMGSVLEEESLVLTYNDLFDYLRAILGAKELPTEIRTCLDEAEHLIFVGFRFEKWYMQMILRLLNFYNRKGNASQYAFNQSIADDVRSFYYDQFKIEFVDTQIEQFATSLLAACQKENLVRQPSTGTTDSKPLITKTISEQMEECIRTNRMQEALTIAGNFAKQNNNSDLENTVLQLSGTYALLQSQKHSGTITAEMEFQQNNKIRDSIIYLKDEIKRSEQNS